MHGYDFYRSQAAKFREMATGCDDLTAESLLMLASDYEAEALRQERLDMPQAPTLKRR